MTTTQTIDLDKFLPWSEPRKVPTARGVRIVRKAAPTAEFWNAWKTNKRACQEAGLGVSKFNGRWEVCWWTNPDADAERREQEERKQAVAASRAADLPGVDLACPAGVAYLGYQKAGIAFALAALGAGRGCLIGDEMGLGKTIQAIGVINNRPDISKVVIICPNTLKRNWARELSKWLTRPLTVSVVMAGGTFPHHADIVLINFDIVKRYAAELNGTPWDLRIIDEAHYVKNPKAQRTKATLAIPARCKIALTGTPIENRPVELFPVINDLDPAGWPNFFGYAKRYCAAHKNGFGWDFTGASNLDELQHRLRSTIMVRRLKADVLTELPPKQRQVIELDSTDCKPLLNAEAAEFALADAKLLELRARVELAKAGESRADYDAAVSELRKGQGVAFELMAKMRHAVAMAKLPQCVAFVSDALENGKVIVFCHHLDIVQALREALADAQPAVITGDVPGDKRQAEVDRFQKDPACRVFIGNNAAAEGITLTAASHVVFVELDWVPGKLAQKEDRAHRIGQKDSVLCSYLVLEGSLDAHMAQTNVDKMNVIDSALDRVNDYTEAEVVDVEPVTKIALTFEEVAKQAKTISDEAAALALAGLRRLAAVCDGAVQDDGHGFNSRDTYIGKALSRLEKLSPKQAVLAAKLCVFYKGQLGPEFTARLQAAMVEK